LGDGEASLILFDVSRLAYPELVGGVLNMRREHFLLVNGYSNLYWGWGAEDDDMAYRQVPL
jgi:predicted glycosyltransferase involved in capsule biosynthesis